MSPRGRVKVALAGVTTKASAVGFTLLEVAATGRLTTKKTLPTIVATKQSGRTTTASATTIAGSGVVSANVEVVLAIQTVTAQIIVISLVFMVFSYTQRSLIVEIFAMTHRAPKMTSRCSRRREEAEKARDLGREIRLLTSAATGAKIRQSATAEISGPR